MRTIQSLIVASFVLLPISVQAQLNKCTGPDGKVSYQSEPCPTASKAQTVQPPSDPGYSGGGSKADKGWDGASVERMRSGCVTGAMSHAQTGWERDPKAGPFPTSEWRASAEPYCTCLVDRVRASVKPEEFEAKGAAAFVQFTNEAIAGGKCKPTGIMGKALGF